MTHDKLLVKLMVMNADESEQARLSKTTQALRVIVELHKPFDFELAPDVYKLVCTNCQMGVVEQYPCQTIQAIEKELG
jgi:hypothetical protein